MTVMDVLQRVDCPLLEPAGFMLGLISPTQFLDYLSDSINDFLRMTGISKIFATQTINYGIGQYQTPDAQLSIEQVFVQARFLPASDLDTIDNAYYQWKRKTGVAKTWYQDGLPIKNVGIVFSPNWQGAPYSAIDPEIGYQIITSATIGNFFGSVTTNGQAVAWVSGQTFQDSDATWQGKTFTVNGVAYLVQSVTDPENLLLTTSAGVQASAVAYSIQYPINIPAADRNLTTYGSQLPPKNLYALTDTIPLLPDSAAMYLAWGILQKIYSDDSELKDSQKAAYCGARWQEGINIFRAALLEQYGDSDDE